MPVVSRAQSLAFSDDPSLVRNPASLVLLPTAAWSLIFCYLSSLLSSLHLRK